MYSFRETRWYRLWELIYARVPRRSVTATNALVEGNKLKFVQRFRVTRSTINNFKVGTFFIGQL